MRNDVRCVGAEEAKNGLKEDDGCDAVDIVVAVDQNRFSVPDRALDSLARRCDAVNSAGIVEIVDLRRNEAAVFVFGMNAAPAKDRRDDRMSRKAVPSRLR